MRVTKRWVPPSVEPESGEKEPSGDPASLEGDIGVESSDELQATQT